MLTLWIAPFALAIVLGEQGTPAPTATPSAAVDQEPLVPARTGTELRDAVRSALRRWARPSDKAADLAAREFLALYRELQADDRLALGQREQLRTKVRGRLLKLSEQISRRAAVQRRLARDRRPESVDAATGIPDVLAQFGAPRPGGFGWPGGFGGPGFGGPGFAGPGFGGGMPGGGPFGAGAGVNDDYGQDLVELIQHTIAPNTWDVNGGLGTIYYWRPGRAMVIRQTGEVHGQIGDLLEQMGRIGR